MGSGIGLVWLFQNVWFLRSSFYRLLSFFFSAGIRTQTHTDTPSICICYLNLFVFDASSTELVGSVLFGCCFDSIYRAKWSKSK